MVQRAALKNNCFLLRGFRYGDSVPNCFIVFVHCLVVDMLCLKFHVLCLLVMSVLSTGVCYSSGSISALMGGKHISELQKNVCTFMGAH